MEPLDSTRKCALLEIMLESRMGDLREESLLRQGKGLFHATSMGHEAVAAVALHLEDDEYTFPCYRDRAFVMARGLTTRDMALSFLAKRSSWSGGRQMHNHFSSRRHNIWSMPSPVAANLLPACGVAWGIKMDDGPGVVVAATGDGSTRQGEFFEALCFAKEMHLPVLFVVEDNGYAISTSTRGTTPLDLDVLDDVGWVRVNGRVVEEVHTASGALIDRIRDRGGPACLWIEVDRMSPHSSASGHQRKDLSNEVLARINDQDPVQLFKTAVVRDGVMDADELCALESNVETRVRRAYEQAETEEEPRPEELETHLFGPIRVPDDIVLGPGRHCMADALGKVFREALNSDSRTVFFGEDIEDPLGGIFALTKGLSTEFSDRVINSPLAEATILGVACGLACYGKRPVFEMQFVDFIHAGWNQLVTNLATLRWRSFGEWNCPAVIYAHYGAIGGGAIWHSQANEALFSHVPGLSVVVPSTPEDAAGLMWTAMHGEDPVMFMIPKKLLRIEVETHESTLAIPLGEARVCHEGAEITLVTWGNMMERAYEALDQIKGEVSIELIDLRTVMPWDKVTVERSVRKTGRLVVVQEDTENCSVGQMIIAHVMSSPKLWKRMVSPPQLVSTSNVYIGFSPVCEDAALPGAQEILDAIDTSIAESAAVVRASAKGAPALETRTSSVAETTERRLSPALKRHSIQVPHMGEGFYSAKIVSILKEEGQTVQQDDPLCEMETDKAIFAVESPVDGVLREWKTSVDDSVSLGQEIAVIDIEADKSVVAGPKPSPAAVPHRRAPVSPFVQSGAKSPPPALTESITSRSKGVLPATISMSAKWEAVRKAREFVKSTRYEGSPTPSAMVAWCIVRALEKHSNFRCLILDDDTTVEQKDFDLGLAVAWDDDQLSTAVVQQANRLNWFDFLFAYENGVKGARDGRVMSKANAPFILTSMGPYGVRTATPIVVPPAMATLFIGTKYYEVVGSENGLNVQEVVTLTLTFDHRFVNGAGAAAFLREIQNRLETFTLPE